MPFSTLRVAASFGPLRQNADVVCWIALTNVRSRLAAAVQILRLSVSYSRYLTLHFKVGGRQLDSGKLPFNNAPAASNR
jgi:hypothetical protein